MLRNIISGKKSVKVAINGFGRIGRSAFKVMLKNPKITVVALNDLADIKTLAHLLQYDSVYGAYSEKIMSAQNSLSIGKRKFEVTAIKDPAQLPWQSLDVDVVLECTGRFCTTELAGAHLRAGAKKVIISAPAKDEETITCVKGVNENILKKNVKIISMASCTTNGLAAVTEVIHRAFGIKKALMTTVHAYTADQSLVDGPHKDLRRARAAAVNIIPTTTGAAIATTKTIPQLAGKFDGMAMRVPVVSGSIIDVVYVLGKKATEQKINEALRQASGQAKYKGIITVTKDPIVSSDIVGNPASAIVDLSFTKVIDGDLAKVIIWYDNEWGYANRLAEMAAYFGSI
ncbi:MAG: type I glyceraldehyde-3-phosphate dehydrogenase [bacterium]|nr:type I glyceraldehyde-3-phosphate dehydrogenase [bacterium]